MCISMTVIRRYLRCMMGMWQVAKLAPESFRQVMSTLDFGLTQPDPEVSTAALEGMAAISRFHFNSLKGKATPPLLQPL